MKKVNEILYMTRDEVAEVVRRNPVAILPIGATEQHGHHLPLGVDILLAEYMARRVAAETGALLLPSLPFGYSWVWRDIPGTVSLQQHHVEAVLKDIAHSVSRYGVKLLVVINGHEANNASLKYACRELEDELDIPMVYLFYPELQRAMNECCESQTWNGMFHACEFETSLMLAVKPEWVHMDKAVKEYPETPPLYGRSAISVGRLSQSGVYGDPTLATREKGKKMLEIITEAMVRLVRTAYENI